MSQGEKKHGIFKRILQNVLRKTEADKFVQVLVTNIVSKCYMEVRYMEKRLMIIPTSSRYFRQMER